MTLSREFLEQLARETGHELSLVQVGARDLIFGEEHWNEACIQAQLRFIEKYRPEIVLHELYGTKVYDPEIKKSRFRREAPRNELDDKVDEHVAPILEKADEFGFTLIGCDLTYGEMDRMKYPKLGKSIHFTQLGTRSFGQPGYLERIKNILDDLGVPYSNKFPPDLNCILDPERHEEMAKVYNGVRQHTEKPILMIVGKYHVLDIPGDFTSPLLEKLDSPHCVMEIKEENLKYLQE